jgi:hypothetical protein
MNDICKNTYETIIFIIFCIIIITLFVAFIILMLNIINYILFTVYCIGDNINDYTSDAPNNIILGNKYKFRLLNYVKNINDNKPENNYKTNTVVKEYYDTNSSDLFIHKTIIYYNYMVKLLLIIMLIIVIGLLYNVFNIGIMSIKNCDNTVSCGFLPKEILSNDTYVYYIIIIIFLYIFVHSYVYTFFFNQNIYMELYNIYGGENGMAGNSGENGENKYKTTDTIVFNSISFVVNNSDKDTDIDKQTSISLYLNELKKLSFGTLDLHKFDIKNGAAPDSEAIISVMNEGIINNNKFRVPIELEKEENINTLFKRIYKTNLNGIKKDVKIDENTKELIYKKKQKLLGNMIFIYLIYHYTISNNLEDPFIIHKLNNIFLNLFDNLYNKYNIDKINKENGSTMIDGKEKDVDANLKAIDAAKAKEEAKPKETAAANKPEKIEDPYNLIESFDPDINKMFKEIRGAYTIKLLLPVGTKGEALLFNLHENADLILKYINKFQTKMMEANSDLEYNKVLNELTKYDNINKHHYKADGIYTYNTIETLDVLYDLKKTIKDNIEDFAKGFSEFKQEDKTLDVVNRVVYKINFYLAVEMMETIIYIVLVLLILYKSGKYPYMEKYINLAITYAILIINELISAILGII